MRKLSLGTRSHDAPLAIIVCAETGIAWKRPQDGLITTQIDATIVTDHMMLQATNLGLGTCWLTWFDPAIIRKEFAIPEQFEIINILVIGYASDDAKPKPKDRLELTATTFFEKF